MVTKWPGVGVAMAIALVPIGVAPPGVMRGVIAPANDGVCGVIDPFVAPSYKDTTVPSSMWSSLRCQVLLPCCCSDSSKLVLGNAPRPVACRRQ